MRKLLFTTILIVSLLFFFVSAETLQVITQNYKLNINGQYYTTSWPILNYNGCTYMSITELCSDLGLNVSRDKTNMTINIERPRTIVMLGDSLTNAISWNSIINNPKYYFINQAVAGYTTDRLMTRLSNVYDSKPDMCIIMVGINDLIKGKEVDEVYTNYISIVESISSKNIKPVITSTLYVSRDDILNLNPSITDLNNKLKEYSVNNGISFFDLNASMNPEKVLSSQYTREGLHLNDDGNRLWAEELGIFLQVLN